MNNSIYLRRKHKLYLEKGTGKLDTNTIATLLKNIDSLGFTLSKEVLEIVSTFSIEEVDIFYRQLVDDLKMVVGANVIHCPMYPNFPQQVMEMAEAQLYFNAMMHYFGDWIGKRIMPLFEKKERAQLTEEIELKTIDLGNKDDFYNLFTSLLKAKTSISDTDKKDVEWFVIHTDNLQNLIPELIPLKENVALLGGLLIKHTTISEEILKLHIKTATDILRLCVALSNGDISLAKNTKFLNIPRKQRKLILRLLENCNCITDDMIRYPNVWKRVGEILHPFEYKTQFPKCFDAFDIIRNNKPFYTFNGTVEKALAKGEFILLVSTLKTRAGEFARRLDALLRKTTDTNLILETFKTIANQVSSPVLLQVLTHFKHRNQAKDLRTFFPKGELAKAYSMLNNLPQLDEVVCEEVVVICETALIEKYQTLPSLGNVYIDPQLKNYHVPFALRSASKALKTIIRGSRIDLPQGNTIRFFIWWKDGQTRTDLDLSAVGLDEKHNYLMDISYYNLTELGGCHSGDITSAPEGASEFIDIDIEKFKTTSVRYIMMCVNSFTEQFYCDLPECFAGFMMRQQADSGEIYEPQTVQNKFDLTANTQFTIPLIIDIVDRKVIWTDLSLKKNPSHDNNVINNKSSLAILSQTMCSLVKPNLYDLFSLHTQARGQKVEDISIANTIFAIEKGIKPTDIDCIISEYL